MPPALADDHGSKRRCRRDGLDEEDPSTDGGGAVETGDDDADQEEDADLEADRVACQQTPDESCDEKPVVQALVGCQRRGPIGEVLVHLERPKSPWSTPQEHLEDDDPGVDQGDHEDKEGRDGRHRGMLAGSTSRTGLRPT